MNNKHTEARGRGKEGRGLGEEGERTREWSIMHTHNRNARRHATEGQ
jgi:hypothetical protein